MASNIDWTDNNAIGKRLSDYYYEEMMVKKNRALTPQGQSLAKTIQDWQYINNELDYFELTCPRVPDIWYTHKDFAPQTKNRAAIEIKNVLRTWVDSDDDLPAFGKPAYMNPRELRRHAELQKSIASGGYVRVMVDGKLTAKYQLELAPNMKPEQIAQWCKLAVSLGANPDDYQLRHKRQSINWVS